MIEPRPTAKPERADRTARTAFRQARAYARRSMLPPVAERARYPWTTRVTIMLRFAFRIVRRVVADRVPQRAAALAFYTLLSVVPILAATFAVLSRAFGQAGSQAVVRFVADRYFPRATDAAIDAVTPLVTRTEVSTAGLLGILLLLPVMTSLVRQAESALSDVFRAPPPPTWSLRFFLHAALALGAPVLAVLGAHYVPHFAAGGVYSLVDLHLGPLLISAAVLYLVYAYLPGRHVRRRDALFGALVAAVLLEAGKLGFSLYVTYLGRGIHLVWGTIAFVPLLLVWVLLIWVLVLLGAEVAATVHELADRLEVCTSGSRHVAVRGWRRRLRRKTARRAASAPPLA